MAKTALPVGKQTVLALRKPKTKERVFELDFLRGFAIILMVLYHFAYDLFAIDFFFKAPMNPNPTYVNGMMELGRLIWIDFIPSESPLQILFSALFMFLCGISCTFSKSNYHRGVKLLILGVTMSIALDWFSIFAHMNVHIYLGIIQSLAIAIIIYSIIDHFFSDYQASFVFTILFAILYCSSFHFDPFNAVIPFIPMEDGATSSVVLDNLWDLLLGRMMAGDDYFSPILTTMLVFLGATVGKTIYKDKKSVIPASIPRKWATPINWLGRHTLAIYILHQPLSILFIAAIVAPAGYTLNI